MDRAILVVILSQFLFLNIAFCQPAPIGKIEKVSFRQPTPLKSYIDILNSVSSSVPTRWSLWYQHKESDYKPLNAEGFIKVINEDNSRMAYDDNYNKYYKNGIEILKELKESEIYFLGESTDRLFNVSKFNDDGIVLSIDGGASETVYNTLRLSSRQRASDAFSKYIITNVKYLKKSLAIPDVKYISFSVCYGSRDFSNNLKVIDLKPEYLCAVMPINELKMFIGQFITVDELVEKSHFYLMDRENTTPNKIRFIIE